MSLKAPKLFLLDVEGTIAPMSLVYEELFPYARTHFERYLQSHSGEAGVVNDLNALAEERAKETDASAPEFSNPDYWDEALPYLNWLMDRDRKSTALKSLQGRIWKGGFERDELKNALNEPKNQPLREAWIDRNSRAIESIYATIGSAVHGSSWRSRWRR